MSQGPRMPSRPPTAPSSRSTSSGVMPPILWLNAAQLVTFLANWPRVVLLLGTSTPQNFLQPVALHFGGPVRARAGLCYYNIKSAADQAWILPLIDAVLPTDGPAPRAVCRGYYLFVRGTALAYHPGLYDPRLDARAQRAEDLLRAATADPVDAAAARQQLHELACEAASLVIHRFEDVLTGNTSQPDVPVVTADPYAVLGIDKSATRPEIKAAYHARMREYHPDRVSGMDATTREAAHRRAQEIIAAYQTLRRLHGASRDSLF